jgi:hypothetical protein
VATVSARGLYAAMSLVVKPSARERFTPRELIAAYEDFIKSEPQYVDAETGHKATAYLFGAGVLLVYEEPESHVVILIHPSAWKVNSAKSICRILDKTT